MTTLGALLAEAGLDVTLPAGTRGVRVSTVELDSRKCTPGSVFVCMPGTTTTGEAFVDDAIARGAICVVASTPVPAAEVSVTVPPASLRTVLAALSSAVVGHPAASLTLGAVTGTNGKTTVTWLLNGILSHAGYTAATIGTLSGGRTTPSAPDLHRQLRAVADRAGRERRKGAVALEVSSHALDQGRVDGLRFDVAVFTNLSHEHLDYHGTMERYFEAKARLFEPPRARTAVICVDDEWGRALASRIEIPMVAVSSEDATIVDAHVGGTTLRWRSTSMKTNLTGRFNVTNTILAAAAADVLGVAVHEAAGALEALPAVPGRLEMVGRGAPSVLVDYAHTPHALERVLLDLREIRASSRLVCVFGCGGDRDVAKRPQMGAIASLLADEVVVTSDNPRGEDPGAIIDRILDGAKGPARVRREPDRAKAIGLAIESANDDDVVLIAGKGHETSQEAAGVFVHFDDREVAAAALQAKGRTVLSLMEAGAAALFVAIAFTPALIRWLRRRNFGQRIREDGPASHVVKAGTPTMGGLLIIAAAIVGYLIGHVGGYRTFTRSGFLVLALVVAVGILGFLDDFVGVRNERNLGLNKRGKFLGQVLIALGFSWAAWAWAGATTTLSFTRYDLPGWQMGPALWIVFATLVVVATSNAVNLTDGVDGLAAGSSTFCFSVLAVLGYWEFRKPMYYVPRGHNPATELDLALVAVALVGGCLGFLWWNAAPARIIMGDTGALAIGAGLAGLCLLMNLDLLLVVIGGLFVLETLSVIAQVISFRVFHRRVLRMAPMHHHFELLGWPETTVLIRFWILAGLFAALGLGTFYGDFVKIAKVL